MAMVERPMTENESPADIAKKIFCGNSYRPIRYLSCTFDNGVLTIGGRLPSFYLKQVAQNAVQEIEGVVQIENRIEVAR